jgi:hypothetical protein
MGIGIPLLRSLFGIPIHAVPIKKNPYLHIQISYVALLPVLLETKVQSIAHPPKSQRNPRMH